MANTPKKSQLVPHKVKKKKRKRSGIRWSRVLILCLPFIFLFLIGTGWFVSKKSNPLKLKETTYQVQLDPTWTTTQDEELAAWIQENSQDETAVSIEGEDAINADVDTSGATLTPPASLQAADMSGASHMADPLGNIESLFMDSKDNVTLTLDSVSDPLTEYKAWKHLQKSQAHLLDSENPDWSDEDEAWVPSAEEISAFLYNADGTLKTGINTRYPHTYQAHYTYNGKEYPFTIEVTDIEAPVIDAHDLTTDLSQTVTAADFVDSVTDATAYSIRIDVNDKKEAGTYPVTITVTDEYGNTAEKEVKLIRREDKTAPQLETFESEVTVKQGSSFAGYMYQPVDDLDPNPTIYSDISQLDLSTPGTYTVTYTVKDRSGNERTYDQTVTVEEDPDYGKPIVYLTFDDGPSENTRRVLQVLDQYDVPATFFVTGTNPANFPIMKEITDSGNAIALHTNSHVYSQLYASDDAYFADLQAISDVVEQQTGVKTDIIRFPGGSSNMISSEYNPGIMSRLVNEVQQKGYQYFDWNVDSTDASGNNVPAATIVQNATSAIGYVNEAVILFHDTDAKDTTVEALPSIIQAYKDAGYVFRPLTKDSFAAHHGVNN